MPFFRESKPAWYRGPDLGIQRYPQFITLLRDTFYPIVIACLKPKAKIVKYWQDTCPSCCARSHVALNDTAQEYVGGMILYTHDIDG